MHQYYEVGKLVATFGVKGALILQHTLQKNATLKDVHCLFIAEKKDSFLPYFLEYIHKKGEQELLLKIEMIDTKEEATQLLKKKIWLAEKDFKRYADTNSLIYLLGFTVIAEQKKIGEIVEIIDNTVQQLAKIIIAQKEVFLPLHSQTIIKIDITRREIQLTLPEGLLDVYLT